MLLKLTSGDNELTCHLSVSEQPCVTDELLSRGHETYFHQYAMIIMIRDVVKNCLQSKQIHYGTIYKHPLLQVVNMPLSVMSCSTHGLCATMLLSCVHGKASLGTICYV